MDGVATSSVTFQCKVNSPPTNINDQSGRSRSDRFTLLDPQLDRLSPGMAAVWRSALPFLVLAASLALENMISTPSCSVSGSDGGGADHPDDLKLMMVADLLLPGADAGYADLLFRLPHTSRSFRKSFEKLKPDMLIVLGDISARGSELTETKWLPILQQFHSFLGPFESLPYLVVLGDRDVGECSKLDWRVVSWISSNFPGLDSAGCTDFEINNISFVSLNVVAMLCGKNELRFDVEKVIERESLGLRSVVKDPSEGLDKMSSSSSNSWWRDNDAAPSSGPVLLLHFPLHCYQSRNFGADVVMEEDVCGNPCCGSNDLGDSGIVNTEPYRLMQTLSPNVTGYIFQSLKPRMVFSGHTHNFCDHKHVDGTREVTVPAMTFSTEGNPGFVIVTFRKDRMVRVCHCSLARGSHVILVYAFTVVMLIIATICMIRGSYLIHSTGG